MYNSALYGFIIWCVGCIIPTPLDRAPPQTNYRPTFVTNGVTPPFGPSTLTINTLTTLSLAATDPNPDDTLTVHLFQPSSTSPGGFIFTGATTTLTTTPDTDDPNLRLGSIESNACLNAADGTKFDLYAVVADRPFNTGTNITMADGGLTDSNHWEMTCSSM